MGFFEGLKNVGSGVIREITKTKMRKQIFIVSASCSSTKIQNHWTNYNCFSLAFNSITMLPIFINIQFLRLFSSLSFFLQLFTMSIKLYWLNCLPGSNLQYRR